MPSKSTLHPIRSPEFAKRFRSACDESQRIPAKHDGRYVYIVSEYKKRAKDTISVETVRKWHQGETSPRPTKIAIIADILACDPIWLQTGHRSTNISSVIPKMLDSTIESIKYGITASIPIPLRPGLTVEIQGLPDNLTEAEAKRISNIILAYAGSE